LRHDLATRHALHGALRLRRLEAAKVVVSVGAGQRVVAGRKRARDVERGTWGRFY
jgi:hypothetical protein